MVERGGRGSRTLVLLTYYRNFDTCVGADQTTGRAFHHQVCCLTWKSIGDRDLYVPSQVTREAHYAAASICARGVILTTLAFICFAISKHDCLHDSLPSISNQNQNTPKSTGTEYVLHTCVYFAFCLIANLLSPCTPDYWWQDCFSCAVSPSKEVVVIASVLPRI